jgi:hypothetical protein
MESSPEVDQSLEGGDEIKIPTFSTDFNLKRTVAEDDDFELLDYENESASK